MTIQDIDTLLEEISLLKEEVQKLKKQKRYGLVWEDKPELFDKESQNALPVLVEKGGKFKDLIQNKDEDFNILIEGDNYHSLSVLKYTHRNKIDVIYMIIQRIQISIQCMVNNTITDLGFMNMSLLGVSNVETLIHTMLANTTFQLSVYIKNVFLKIKFKLLDIALTSFSSIKFFPCQKQVFGRNYLVV